jgi:hypothetical protein
MSCAAIAAFAQGTTGTKTTTITRNSVFPPVGVASDETIQVNVVNISPASSSGTAASCTGSITFTNAAGAVIGKAVPFTVTGSQLFSTSLPFGGLGATGTRAEVVASVQQTLTIPATAPCSLVFSLETYSTSNGETHMVLGNSSISGIAAPAAAGPASGR